MKRRRPRAATAGMRICIDHPHSWDTIDGAPENSQAPRFFVDSPGAGDAARPRPARGTLLGLDAILEQLIQGDLQTRQDSAALERLPGRENPDRGWRFVIVDLGDD